MLQSLVVRNQIITGRDLLARGDIGPAELIDGEIAAMSPTRAKHSFIEFTLGRLLGNFVSGRNLGWVSEGLLTSFQLPLSELFSHD